MAVTRIVGSLLIVLSGMLLATTRVDLNGGLYPGFAIGDSQSTFFMMGAEADVTARVSSRTRDLLTAAVQLYALMPMADWTMGFHFGQAYVLVPIGLRLPTVRAGQAVIPFGLLADYDTHGQIVQTQYARTVGQRIDPGVGVLGSVYHTSYALWVSNGTGPYRTDPDNNKVVTARLAPKFMLGDAELTVGLSGMAGRITRWEPGAAMASMEEPPVPIMKYRLALDNTSDLGPATIRLEGVVGKDSLLSQPVLSGWYAEARYAFVSWLEGLAKYDGFFTPGGSERNLSAGLTFSLPSLSAANLQVVFEETMLMPWSIMKGIGMLRRSWRSGFSLTGLLLIVASSSASLCVWRSPDEDIASIFATAGSYKTVFEDISDTRRQRIEDRLGFALDPDETQFKFFPVFSGEEQIGTVMTHAGKGQFGVIEVVVAVVDTGTGAIVKEVRIQRDREKAKQVLRSDKFLGQFAGMTAEDDFTLGESIKPAAENAVKSSQAVADAVRKLLIVYDEFYAVQADSSGEE